VDNSVCRQLGERPTPNIIVYRAHNLCYINSPKSACSTIKAALAPLLGIDASTGANIHALYKQHPEVGRYSFDTIPNNCFKFTCIRNPFDRLVSFYAEKVWHRKWEILAHYGINPGNIDNFREDFEAFVSQVFAASGLEEHLARQVPTLRLSRMDCVLRFETFARDFPVILSMAGLDVPLPYRNKSRHGHYTDYYTPYSRELAECLYREDLDVLGYSCKKSCKT